VNEYIVFISILGNPPVIVRLLARNKNHATLLAGHTLGNRTDLAGVDAIDVKLMRRG
jgi:hypothetical protein